MSWWRKEVPMTAGKKYHTLNRVMPEKHQGPSFALMLAILAFAILAALAIAWGMVSRFFPH